MTSLADVAKTGLIASIPLGWRPMESPSPAVQLAEALRKRLGEVSAELAELKAKLANALADAAEQRRAKELAQGFAAEWQSRCERLEAVRRA